MNFELVLVPQGAEYLAVCKGLEKACAVNKPKVLSIPVGMEPVTRYLTEIQGIFTSYSSPRVLILGLCGSLSPRYGIGDLAVYQECAIESDNQLLVRPLDLQLTNLLREKLETKTNLVRGLTSDRLIWQGKEKLQLGQMYNASVVDMEGFAALEVLDRNRVRVTMLRVVSDDCNGDIPNLNNVISTDGKIEPRPLAIAMIKKPLAAFRLIRGSLIGLKRLQKITIKLFSD